MLQSSTRLILTSFFQLFYTDAPVVAAPNPLDDPFPSDDDAEHASNSNSDSDSDSDDSSSYASSSSSRSSTRLESTHALSKLKSTARQPAWTDPDDINVQVSLSNDKRLRKLRRTEDEDVVGGRELETRLRGQ